jgi:thiamine biosynthesis lipoprotein
VLHKTRFACIHVLLIFLLPACNKPTGQQAEYPYSSSGMTMATSYTIKASQIPNSITAQEINRQIVQLLDKINGQMSTYEKNSELSLFNQNTSTDWLPISTELYEVIKEALKISRLSNGVFDVTVGPLVNLWGFGPDEVTFKKPDEALVNERLNLIGYNHLKLKGDGLFAKKEMPGLYVDLSAIAKGYGVDQVALLLERFGIMSYMVEIGGEIRVKGKNHNGDAWQIAIEKPIADQRVVEKILAITDTGMATSGDYRNFFEVDGVRFPHTIDPRTGHPIHHKLASVTVLSDSSMTADALATVIMVLGPDEGYQFAEQNHIAAFFIIKSDKGFDEKSSTAFFEKTKVTK